MNPLDTHLGHPKLPEPRLEPAPLTLVPFRATNHSTSSKRNHTRPHNPFHIPSTHLLLLCDKLPASPKGWFCSFPPFIFLVELGFSGSFPPSRPFFVTEPGEHSTKIFPPAPNLAISFHLRCLKFCPANLPSPDVIYSNGQTTGLCQLTDAYMDTQWLREWGWGRDRALWLYLLLPLFLHLRHLFFVVSTTQAAWDILSGTQRSIDLTWLRRVTWYLWSGRAKLFHFHYEATCSPCWWTLIWIYYVSTTILHMHISLIGVTFFLLFKIADMKSW